jgi:hypothetical protein
VRPTNRVPDQKVINFGVPSRSTRDISSAKVLDIRLMTKTGSSQTEICGCVDLRSYHQREAEEGARRSHLSKKSHVGQTNKEPFNSPSSRQKRPHLIVGKEQLNHFYSQRTKVLILLNSFHTVVKFNRSSLLQKVCLR